MKRISLLIATAAILTACAVQAQQGERLSRDCRREIVRTCGLTFDRDKIRTCLMSKAESMSQPCRTELAERIRARMDSAKRDAPAGPAKGATEYAYGSDPLQRLDFYPAAARKAPLLIYVHGGGWSRGDKSTTLGPQMASHYNAQGYAVASAGYRMVPAATVEQEAADIASTVAWAKSNAARLGIDPDRIVLMGHSAGAHLVALVGTDPQYLRNVGLGLDAVRGVIPNDGAAYDVPAQMSDGPAIMQKTYTAAFGTDPGRQRALSPTLQAASPNAPSFLLIHVQRPDGVRQANALAEALKRAGTKVQVNGFPGDGLSGHMAINRQLGDPAYPATPVVDAWLKDVLAR